MKSSNKLVALVAALSTLALTTTAVRARPHHDEAKKPTITVYKDPSCGCCKNWIQYLVKHGYQVNAKDTPDMPGIKRTLGVPEQLTSCHTAVVNGYVIEGHVSAEDSEAAGAEAEDRRNRRAGYADWTLDGWTAHSALLVLAFDKNGKTTVFATHDVRPARPALATSPRAWRRH
jgi:hypothetical protein